MFAFNPGESVEFASGYVFGAVSGTVLCLIGVAIATALVFSLTRLFGKKFTEIMLDKKDLKKLGFLNQEKNLEWIFALLYFVIGTPKDVITYFAGITKIKFWKFMLISTFCRIPSVVTSAIAGQALGEENYLVSLIVFGASAVVLRICKDGEGDTDIPLRFESTDMGIDIYKLELYTKELCKEAQEGLYKMAGKPLRQGMECTLH